MEVEKLKKGLPMRIAGKLVLIGVMLTCVLPMANANEANLHDKTPNEFISQLSQEARSTVPNLMERLSSKDPQVAFELMDEFIVIERGRDAMGRAFRYTLTSSDYSLILQRVLSVSVSALYDQEISATLCEKMKNRFDRRWTRKDLISWLLFIIEYIADVHQIEGVAPSLLLLLEEQDSGIQKRTIKLLVQLRSPLAVSYLIPRLQQERDKPHEIYKVLQAIVRINAREAAEHIVPLLDISDSNTRYWALWALVQLNAREYQEKIFEIVKQSKANEEVRPYGIAVMIKWGDSRAIPMATARLWEKDMYLRETMADRLVELDAKLIVRPLIDLLHNPPMVEGVKGTDFNIQSNAIRLIAKLDPDDAIPTLREYARGTHDYLAMVAAEALGEIRAEEGVPELLALLDKKDPSGGTWHSATLSLSQIGQPNTIPRVLSELKQNHLSSHHARVLQHLSIVSDPDIYQKLHDLEIENLEALHIPESLTQLSERCDIPMILSKNVDPNDYTRIVSFATKDTAIKHLLRIINMFNYSEHKYTFFVADGIVNIVTIEEAYRFWDAWYRGRLSNP